MSPIEKAMESRAAFGRSFCDSPLLTRLQGSLKLIQCSETLKASHAFSFKCKF